MTGVPPDNAASDDDATARGSGASYGPDIAGEAELRLLGAVDGRRVLDLGCGVGRATVAFARAGATAIGIDGSPELLAAARRLAEEAEVRVELRRGDLADLAFLRADSIDAAFSSYAFDAVDDIGRVFRQVHRVLKVGAPLAFSVAHPVWAAATGDRSYFDRTPTPAAGPGGVTHPRTMADLYTALVRASYRVDALLEPEPVPHGPRSPAWDPAMLSVPLTLVVRARKEGN